jgi:3-deoxy-D-manno-octulosonate 8-phosphate phosphatase (KDO 8-P phosphatase)
MKSRAKIEDFNDFCTRNGLKAEEVMYFGDDVPDIPVMLACGCGICPADAVDQVKEIADYVSPKNGGKGCVRAAIEMVMRLQGEWELDVDHYKKMF